MLTKQVTYNIRITGVDKLVPTGQLENIKEWVKHNAIECGPGDHTEHYGYTEDCEDDIRVSFHVSIDFN